MSMLSKIPSKYRSKAITSKPARQSRSREVCDEKVGVSKEEMVGKKCHLFQTSMTAASS